MPGGDTGVRKLRWPVSRGQAESRDRTRFYPPIAPTHSERKFALHFGAGLKFYFLVSYQVIIGPNAALATIDLGAPTGDSAGAKQQMTSL